MKLVNKLVEIVANIALVLTAIGMPILMWAAIFKLL